MTPAELDAIEAREKAATEGPWRAVAQDGGEVFHGFERGVVTGWDHPQLRGPLDITGLGIDLRSGRAVRRMDATDAEFIAHARSDVPALVAEVRRLRGLLEAERARLAEIDRKWPATGFVKEVIDRSPWHKLLRDALDG